MSAILDASITAEVSVANKRGQNWVLSHSERRTAEGVVEEIRQQFPRHTFVKDALAEVPETLDEQADVWG